MGKKRLLVVHKPGGYEGYKDQVPIRGANIKAISIIAFVIFSIGFVVGLAFFVPSYFASPTAVAIVPTAETVEVTAETTAEASPSPTAMATATNTPQPSPTPDLPSDAMMTLEALQQRLDVLAQTAQPPTPTAMPTLTSVPTMVMQPTAIATTWTQHAVVVVDRAIVRASSGVSYRAIDTISRGARYPVIQVYRGWVQIYYEGADSAWVAEHLLRIENQ